MRVLKMAIVVLACAAQTACVTQWETLPPETRAELLRLGRIITDENETEETRYNSRILYCDLVRETIKKHGEKSVDRQTVIDSFMENGREPKGLSVDDGMLYYVFECKDETLATLSIYFGGWKGSSVHIAFPGCGIP